MIIMISEAQDSNTITTQNQTKGYEVELAIVHRHFSDSLPRLRILS